MVFRQAASPRSSAKGCPARHGRLHPARRARASPYQRLPPGPVSVEAVEDSVISAEASALIDRPIEDVFAFASDQQNEPG